jgi:hypothetical protein
MEVPGSRGAHGAGNSEIDMGNHGAQNLTKTSPRPDVRSQLADRILGGLLFVHHDTAAGAEPSPSEVVASARKAKPFRLLRLAYKAGNTMALPWAATISSGRAHQ